MLRYKKLSLLVAILFIGIMQPMQRCRLSNDAVNNLLRQQKKESAIKDLWWQSIACCFAGISCYLANGYPSPIADPTFGEAAKMCCCCCAATCLISNACISCLAACHRQKELKESLKKMCDIERAE